MQKMARAQAVLLGQLAAISWDDVVAQYHPDDAAGDGEEAVA
jgi:hypothetical protein